MPSIWPCLSACFAVFQNDRGNPTGSADRAPCATRARRRRAGSATSACPSRASPCGSHRSEHLMAEARVQPLRVVRVGDASPPHLDHLVVGAQEHHVALARAVFDSGPSRSSRSHSGVFGSAWSRLMVSIGIWRGSMKSFSRWRCPGVSESSPRMMPDVTSMPVAVQRLIESSIGTALLCAFASRRARRLRRLDADRTC